MNNIERALKDTHCWVADECGKNAVEAIQSLIRAEVESVLDRLWHNSEVMNDDVNPVYGVPLSAIGAERNKWHDEAHENKEAGS